jgi:hypothetical protein
MEAMTRSDLLDVIGEENFVGEINSAIDRAKAIVADVAKS